MRFGYMSGWRGDLLSEFAFAKRHFDFTEVTVLPDMLSFVENALPELNGALAGFPVIGHLHWDFSDVGSIMTNVTVMERLGAKAITIHPFESMGVSENLDILSRVFESCRERGILLMIENVSNEPYSTADGMAPLLEGIPEAGLTLDVGHADKNGELTRFISRFGNRVRHIHLHDHIGQLDHLFFTDRDRLDVALSGISGFGYDGTVTLETFATMRDGQSVSLGFEEITSLHPAQVEMARK